MGKDYYKPLLDSLTINKSNIEGLGLFATEDIPIGANLGISHVKDSRFPDGFIRTPLGGFYNYSEEPNCHTVADDHPHSHSQFQLVSLVTNRDIKCGEELTCRYTLYDPTK
jgi:SET domain-containing protein